MAGPPQCPVQHCDPKKSNKIANKNSSGQVPFESLPLDGLAAVQLVLSTGGQIGTANTATRKNKWHKNGESLLQAVWPQSRPGSLVMILHRSVMSQAKMEIREMVRAAQRKSYGKENDRKSMQREAAA